MSQANVGIVRRILSRWAAGDFGAALAHLDPHVVFVVRDDFPESGVFVGLDAIRDYMRRFLGQWEHYAMEGAELRVLGDTILARVIQRGRGKMSGIESEMKSFALFTFRGESIVRMELVLEETDALEAVGLRE